MRNNLSYFLKKTDISSPECHFWLLDMSQISDDQLAFLSSTLDESSIRKYRTFIREERKKQFLTGRILLKQAIATMSGIDVSDIHVVESASYKPAISIQKHLFPETGFSISHSCNWVACAIHKQLKPIGLDIEFHNKNRDFMRIAHFAFTDDQVRSIQTQPVSGQSAMFYDLWTRKEALYKLASNMEKRHNTTELLRPDDHIIQWHTQWTNNLAIAICS